MLFVELMYFLLLKKLGDDYYETNIYLRKRNTEKVKLENFFFFPFMKVTSSSNFKELRCFQKSNLSIGAPALEIM